MPAWSKDNKADKATYECLRERGQVGFNVPFDPVGSFILGSLPYFSHRASTLKRRAKWLASRMVNDMTNGSLASATVKPDVGTKKDAATKISDILSKGDKKVSDLSKTVRQTLKF